MGAQTHTDTHRHKGKHTQSVRSSLMGLRLGPLCATSENTGPSARYTPNCMVGLEPMIFRLTVS